MHSRAQTNKQKKTYKSHSITYSCRSTLVTGCITRLAGPFFLSRLHTRRALSYPENILVPATQTNKYEVSLNMKSGISYAMASTFKPCCILSGFVSIVNYIDSVLLLAYQALEACRLIWYVAWKNTIYTGLHGILTRHVLASKDITILSRPVVSDANIGLKSPGWFDQYLYRISFDSYIMSLVQIWGSVMLLVARGQLLFRECKLIYSMTAYGRISRRL